MVSGKANGLATVPGSKILVVAPEPFYQDRGTPIALLHVLRALSELGSEVDLLTYCSGEDVQLPGLCIRRIGAKLGIKDVPIGFSIRKVLLDIVLTFSLIRLSTSGSYCCIHAVEEAAFPAAMLGRRFNIPVVYDMQSSLPEQLSDQSALFRLNLIKQYLRRSEDWLLRNVDRIICSTGLAQYVRNSLPGAWVDEWRFPSQRIQISASEAEELRKKYSLTPQHRVVLYSGNFARYQGVTDIAEAMPQILSAVPDVVFVFVGLSSDSDQAWADKLTERFGQSYVRFLPRQPREVATKLLLLADVLVSPRTENSNLPLKIFDYLAAAKPIVATDISSHRLVLDDKCALFFDHSSSVQLATSIVSILEDRMLAQSLSTGARARADEICSWKGFVDQVKTLYHQPIKKPVNC